MCHRKTLCNSRWILLLLIAFVLSACTSPMVNPTLQEEEQHFSTLADAAGAQETANRFLDAWRVEDYTGMYELLSAVSKDAFTLEYFTETYLNSAKALTLEGMNYQILSAMAGDYYGEVAYRFTLETRLMGELTREVVMNLEKEHGEWRVLWETGLILPELRGGNTLEFVHQIPSRGRIYDRNGEPLAAYENAVAIGLVPGELLPEQSEQVFEVLSGISSYSTETLQSMVESTPDDWYLPIVSLSQVDAAPHLESLQGLEGIRIDDFRSRFYVDGGVAPHALGYMLFIPEDALETFQRLGYRQDERIGAAGLEAAFETELSGKRGGSLYVKDPNGKIISMLASSEPIPGQTLTTTLDKNLQMKLQASFGDLRAAAVVMEVDTGRILALVSNPDFDPNAFDLTEIDRSLLESYFSNPDQPLFNRATQGQYPLGSVFKTISMATALDTNIYSLYSTLNCGQSMWVCDSVTLYDWTYSYGVASSGLLNLSEGLMRSCNPWFYRIGERLYEENLLDALPNMAYGFGLGEETGIDIPEAAGNIPLTTQTCMDGAQMAIGQGEVLVTPIQVVRFFAALANGGTLFRPALLESIDPASGDPTYQFSPEIQGTLPISDETLASIQEALRMVVEETRGTGYWAMEGLDIPVSGKTGTAQTPTGNSHAWFAGYTRQNDPQRPDIAVVVLIENGGEGSVMAAPVFRRAVSLYFSNYEDPSGTMPWEDAPYVPTETNDVSAEDSTSGD